jgi:hypothetical protein
MNLKRLLDDRRGEVVKEALEAVRRAHLAHYDAVGTEETRRRLESLYELIVQCAEDRRIRPMLKYSDKVAAERFEAGYGLFEVQTAFNVLEEAIWKRVLEELPPEELAGALGVISTILGMGKDALARSYVSLASSKEAPSLDLRAVFKGTVGA